tara:strand:+ start:308 stop:640 length:333 start_codon:yes stop_codon:yes gene_type:complete
MNKRKSSFKGGRTKKRKAKKSKRKIKNSMTEKKYQELIKRAKSKKRLTKRQKKSLQRELKKRYCRCLLSQKSKGKGAFAICGNSIYYNRGLKPDKYPISCKKNDKKNDKK